MNLAELMNLMNLRGIEHNTSKDIEMLVSDEHSETAQKARRDAYIGGLNISNNSASVPLKKKPLTAHTNGLTKHIFTIYIC